MTREELEDCVGKRITVQFSPEPGVTKYLSGTMLRIALDSLDTDLDCLLLEGEPGAELSIPLEEIQLVKEG